MKAAVAQVHLREEAFLPVEDLAEAVVEAGKFTGDHIIFPFFCQL